METENRPLNTMEIGKNTKNALLPKLQAQFEQAQNISRTLLRYAFYGRENRFVEIPEKQPVMQPYYQDGSITLYHGNGAPISHSPGSNERAPLRTGGARVQIERDKQ